MPPSLICLMSRCLLLFISPLIKPFVLSNLFFFFHSLLASHFIRLRDPKKRGYLFTPFFLLIASVMSSLYKMYQPDGLFNFKRASVFCSSVALYDIIFLLTTFLFHHGFCSSMIFFLSGCLRTRGSVNCKVI